MSSGCIALAGSLVIDFSIDILHIMPVRDVPCPAMPSKDKAPQYAAPLQGRQFAAKACQLVN